MTSPTVFDSTKHSHLLPQFAAIHHACITQDFTLANFLSPLRPEETLRWWKARADEVFAGTRTIIFSAQPSPEWSKAEEGLVVGIVILSALGNGAVPRHCREIAC